MDKKDLAKLAMIGLASGMMVSCEMPGQKAGDEKKAPMEQVQMDQKEQNFYNKLNINGKKTFESMNHDERAAAIKRSEQGCKGSNDCKGLGGCKTSKHSCKGQNDCKGQGGCAVAPDKAVELVDKTMKDKRQKM